LNAVVFNEPGAMELEEIETGDNGPGEVLARRSRRPPSSAMGRIYRATRAKSTAMP
jgi:hypothetical protein